MRIPASSSRLAALAIAVAAIVVALHVCGVFGWPWALALACLTAGIGYFRGGWIGCGVALPAVALALGPGYAWIICLAAGLCGAIGWCCVHIPSQVERDREAEQHAIVQAKRLRERLTEEVARFPELMATCQELSESRDRAQLAYLLADRVRGMMPGLLAVRVHLQEQNGLVCAGSCDARGASCVEAPGDDERYVVTESRTLIRRRGGAVIMHAPIEATRSDGAGKASDRSAAGVVSVSLHREAGDIPDLSIVEVLGRLAGMGLAAVDLLAESRSLALRDHLTGLYGRQEFLRRASELAGRARRRGGALVLIMADLDRLKAVNDQYGHAAGDVVLKAAADAIAAAVPPTAVACRWGGEEFAVVVRVPDKADAAQLGERIRAAVAARRIAEPPVSVSASIGVAIADGQEDPAAALARADGACYRAKSGGRNRVEVAS